MAAFRIFSMIDCEKIVFCDLLFCVFKMQISRNSNSGKTCSNASRIQLAQKFFQQKTEEASRNAREVFSRSGAYSPTHYYCRAPSVPRPPRWPHEGEKRSLRTCPPG